MRHPIKFVGAGPGDPELITVKGKNALEQADLVIYAGSLVPEAVLSWTRSGAKLVNSASMHLTEIIEEIVEGYAKGLRIVRLHTGDPSLYGAILEQFQLLNHYSIPFEIIPGVTAAFAAAAALEIEYTLPEITQSLIITRMPGRTPVPETESLKSMASHKASMAIYLSMSLIDKVAEILEETYGGETFAVIAYCVSQPNEKIYKVPIKDLAESVHRLGIKKQALIIVSKVLNIDKIKYFSKLYDKGFSHLYRQADDDE